MSVQRTHSTWFHLVKSPGYFSAVDEVRETHTARAVEQADIDVRGGGERRSGFRGIGMDGTRERSFTGLHALGKLPGSVWTIPSEPLIIPPAVARHYNLPDHFAAFPQEWPRRIILGWSPSGICVECGEGRRPVVAKKTTKVGTLNSYANKEPTTNFSDYTTSAVQDVAITGYSCACPSLPPTRRPVILDPFGGTGTVAMVARALGRFGVSLDLSADYNRLARWRIWSSGHGAKAMQRTHRDNQGDLFATPPERPVEDVVSL